ncbi:MAG TPA: YceI family protein [Gammaproteobacteria bacterium]|nr:YceI family protein [Gammaproteobacteria bacterium]
MTRKILRTLCGGVLFMLAACAVQPEKPEVVEIPFDPAAKGAPTHVVDSANSSARIRVYRAGAISGLGHNHIVLARDIRGEAWLGTEPAAAAFHLVLPVAAFVVDPPDLRAQAGPDFASKPSLEDVNGTRNNMLGERVLNAAQYPELEIWSERIRGSGDELTADVVVSARGQLSRVSVPVVINTSASATVAQGSFSLRQTDIGITPFSILMGAIAVRDELEIEYNLSLDIK